MALVKVCGAEKPIVLIPGDSGERRVVHIAGGLRSKVGSAMTTNTFFNATMTLRTGGEISEK